MQHFAARREAVWPNGFPELQPPTPTRILGEPHGSPDQPVVSSPCSPGYVLRGTDSCLPKSGCSGGAVGKCPQLSAGFDRQPVLTHRGIGCCVGPCRGLRRPHRKSSLKQRRPRANSTLSRVLESATDSANRISSRLGHVVGLACEWAVPACGSRRRHPSSPVSPSSCTSSAAEQVAEPGDSDSPASARELTRRDRRRRVRLPYVSFLWRTANADHALWRR